MAGLKLIVGRATAGDAIWLKATVDRIADILARQGDTDPVDVAAPNPRWLAGPATRIRHLAVAITRHRIYLVNATGTHPWATPSSQKQSGTPPQAHCRNWPADPTSRVSLAVRLQLNSLITSDAV